ncbi:addiction module toxin RelE [Mediterranea sp. An20]|uniref:type II toxin-antitoxin system RelE/ParE family toxin n=1 Tax=Mediterranea sp. An20 TaxID=1965586 RepID=UPI000B3A4A75|nr:type II toxin-antitoxin system RelE/ParE family toxin [Mediterranea sp. An20]OUP08821.1 addiction module toxin RelE [Mediterranea sp. An20]
MECKITASKSFNKELKRLGKRYASLADDYETLLHDLKQNPALGTDLGRGLRKVRMRISSKGKGKSGGARVITFTVIASIDETTINLLYIYDKSERENISPKEIDALLIANGFIAQP